MSDLTRQEKLDALDNALRSVSDVRMGLCDAGLLEYNEDDPIYASSCALSDLLDEAYRAAKNEADWSPCGTREEWRTHGTVIVAEPGNTGRYALDPDFKLNGQHFVWLNGYGETFDGDPRPMWAKVY